MKRTTYASILVLLLLLIPTQAAAQNNSLFARGRTRGAAPSSQPVAAAPMVPVKPLTRSADAPPAVNPTLMASSLIAVEPPVQKKFRVHDLITVIVREDKRSTSDAKLQSDKKWDISTQLQDWIRLNGDSKLVPQNFTNGRPNVGFQYNDKYDGTGKSERKDSLTTRITATVIDVKPNGLLVLEARKTITNEEDVQVTTLTGSCRGDDVTPDNTVLSTQLADVAIETKSSGPAQDGASRGWIKKLVDFLKPL
jgi:flagellar L-ring protein FlgH